MPQPVELAPVGALRVAAWPVETLDPFGSLELFDAATSLRDHDAKQLRALEGLYETVLARERDALWQRTALDPRFMKALAIANPSLARKVKAFALRHGSGDRPRNKRARHLETTLYRLLARAVGRTEPFGAWCGVALVDVGADTCLRRIPPARCVAPNLSFFAAVLASLAKRDDVRRSTRYRLNPTLGRKGDGSWAYWAPPPETSRGRGTLASSEVLDAALERLGGLGSFTVADAERVFGAEPHALDAFVFDELAANGILVGTLHLPIFFSDAWDALRQIQRDLPVPNTDAWRRITRELEEICARVEDVYETASVETIAELGERAAACGAAFAAALDLEGLPALELHMDSTAPFALTLGASFRARLATAVTADEADTSGSVRAFNEKLRRAQCALLGEDGVALAGLDESVMADLWDVDRREAVPPQEYFPEWPLRTVLVNLIDAPEQSDGALTTVTLLDDAASALSRFVPCLERQDAGKTRELVDWLRCAHHECFRSPRLAALAEASTRAPNAAAQPDLGLSRRSLWSAEQSRSLAGARIVGIAERGLVALAIDDDMFALAPLSAVNLASGDPVLQLLLMSSMRFPRRPEGEPQDSLADDRRPATTSKVQGVDRFVAWCTSNRDATRGHVMARRSGAAPLRVPMTSPLAISALLEGAEDCAMQLDPVDDTPFVRDEGGRYVAQLVMPFRRPAGLPFKGVELPVSSTDSSNENDPQR